MLKFVRSLVLLAGLLTFVPNAHADQSSIANALPLTLNTALSVHLANDRTVLTFTVTGLTGSGATLTLEDSSDAGAHYFPSTGAAKNTITADGQYSVNVAGRTNAELLVTTGGSGSATVSWTLSGALRRFSLDSRTVESCVLAPTVTITNSYGTDYVVGGVLHFTGVFTPTGTGVWQNVNVNIKQVEGNSFSFVPLKAQPTGSFNDAAVAAITASDVDLVRAPVSLTRSSILGTHTNLSATQLGIVLAPGTTDLWGLLVANSSLTSQFTSTGDVTSVCVEVFDDM